MFSIASGSSGNSAYIGTDNTHILVDVGVAMKTIKDGLKIIDIDISDISAILITHEHTDHIKSIGSISRKYNIPIYTSRGSIEAIKNISCLGIYDVNLFNEIEADKIFTLGDIDISPFFIKHDAKEPLAYRLSHANKSVAIATDIGSFDEYTINNLKNLDAFLIEANHEVRMLEMGTYPYDLKRRILGDFGHLSNENSGKLICEILNDKIKKIYLGHLSSDNNHPDIALMSVKNEIDFSSNKYKSKDLDIEVAKKNYISSIIEI